MELEELKDVWQKYNSRMGDNTSGFDNISVQKKSWVVRNKIAISGGGCIVIALLLFVLLLVHIIGSKEKTNLVVIICCSVLGMYAFVKGVFTLLYDRTINKTDNEVNKFMLDNLKNQLYFVYEQMLWLWILLPFVLLVLPLVVGQSTPIQESFFMGYYILVGVLYLILVVVFSKMLCRKKRKLLSEINQLFTAKIKDKDKKAKKKKNVFRTEY